MKKRNGDSSACGELHAAGVSSETSEASPEARGLSQTMRDPARRKRSVRPKAKSRCQLQSDGNGGESSSLTKRANGLPAGGATTNGKRNSREFVDGSLAASDDATGTTPAGDAAPPSAAACTGRDACAEVAATPSDSCLGSETVIGEESGIVDDRRPRASDDAKEMEMPAAMTKREEPLAFDAPGFVEEMHARVNLYLEYQKLLEADDLKVKQRALELLLEMKYGRGAPANADEPPLRVDVEFPKPQ